MDLETGESQSVDLETGEHINPPTIDAETGERQNPYRRFAHRITLKIPKEYAKEPEIVARKAIVPETVTIAPAFLYLLPTAFIFNPCIAAFLAVLEISLHIWAHRKNKRLRGTGIYYQSPLHVFLSEFCACCREEEAWKKINKIQETRSRLKHCSIECVRQIVT